MTDYKVLIPTPRCDDCSAVVEESQLRKSVRNGVATGPWQCKKCETEVRVRFNEQVVEIQRQATAQNNYFASICSEADPKLAEAIHRARLA